MRSASRLGRFSTARIRQGSQRVLVFLAACSLSIPASGQTVDDTEPNRGGVARTEARDPAYALERLHPAEGYEVELFASEKDFPIGNPVSLTFDAKGRLWVSTLPSYPQRLPDQPPNDKIVILEDRDQDGKADHHIVWAEGLHLPLGFELGDGGAYVSQQPDLLFVQDTDGDDRADRYETILHGFGTEDSHHSISAFTWDPGGALYFQEGTFHHSQVETPHGPVRLVDAGVFRYKPNRHWLEVFVSYPFANPWGHIFDRWGQSFIADASGGANYFGTAISGNAIYPEKRSRMKVFTSVVRPTSGAEFVSSRHFPDHAQGNFLINNTIGFQGIKQHRMIEEGSGFTSEEVEPLLYSTDINFRPVDLQFGPDGALYVVDWFNPLIGHMQYSLRDERRDHGHGRIWRITYPSRPLLEPAEIATVEIRELVELLGAPEERTRYRARRELRERDRAQVLDALAAWLTRIAKDESLSVEEREHRRLEVLWAYQNLDFAEPALLFEMLRSPEPKARAAATRVLRFWRDEIDIPEELLRRQVHDDHPRVRLEAIVALSYLPSAQSAAIALETLDYPTDYYLDYVLGETVRTLRPWWLPLLEQGALETAGLPDQSALYLLQSLDTEQLLGLPPHTLVHRALIRRTDLGQEGLRTALEELAKARSTSVELELAEALLQSARESFPDRALTAALVDEMLSISADRKAGAAEDEARSLASRLAELESSREPGLRQASALARLLAGEAWPESSDATTQVDWLTALARAPNDLQSRHLARVLELTHGQAEKATASSGASPNHFGSLHKVRIEWPARRATLRLSEVMILAGDQNLAPSATVRQSSTAYRGVVSRIHDGDLAGDDEHATITTVEDRPWLELTLPSRDMPSEDMSTRDGASISVEIWRAGPTQAEPGFRVLWLDRQDRVLYQTNDLLWTGRKALVDPDRDIQRAAIRALAAIASGAGSSTALDRLLEITRQPEVAGKPEIATMAIEAIASVGLDALPDPSVDDLRLLSTPVLDLLEETPIELLTSRRSTLIFELAHDLADRLEGAESNGLRQSVLNLAPAQLVLRSVEHEMVYDRKTLTVRAGRPVQLVFENPDVAPHNVVITQPGALVEVGRQADRMAEEDPIDAEVRDYIPENEKILVYTPLVQPGERFELVFLAPEEPGRYPYLCTFPGHWILMNGILEVVAELTAIDVRDNDTVSNLDAVRPYVRDWTMDDLRGDVEKLGSTPPSVRAADLYQELGCDKCHQRDGQGGAIGPDLGEIGDKYQPIELLRHILEPSLAVEERYQSWLLETTEGELLTGLVASSSSDSNAPDPDVVEIRANPLAPEKITIVPRVRIRTLEPSPLSTMPSGLLTTLTREEILDLLRFLAQP